MLLLKLLLLILLHILLMLNSDDGHANFNDAATYNETDAPFDDTQYVATMLKY